MSLIWVFLLPLDIQIAEYLSSVSLKYTFLKLFRKFLIAPRVKLHIVVKNFFNDDIIRSCEKNKCIKYI